MSDDHLPVRISDAERERAVEFLRHHCGVGRLTLDEFSDRVGLVYSARTASDIEALTRDLPAQVPAPAPAAPATTRRSRAVKWTFSMFASNQQRGRWRLEDSTTAVAFMGHCRLDLRQAEVVGSEATIHAIAFMGGVDVVVPEGITVVLNGFAFMGAKQSNAGRTAAIPGAPVIRVQAFAMMGGVTVRVDKPRRVSGRNRDRGRDRRRDHQRQRRADGVALAAAAAAAAGMPSPPGVPVPPARILHGIEAVAGAVREEWPAVRARVAPEGTVTILFSDIEGFTSITERLGDYRASALLQEHYRLVRDQLAQHGGFEVKVHGDGFMVAFSSASRGLRCAKAIQGAQLRWNDEHPDVAMNVRMGLHTGEAIRDADDFLGTTVNLASRIAAAAGGGQILVSALLRELCLSTGEFEFDGGEVIELRGLSQPHTVYSVRW